MSWQMRCKCDGCGAWKGEANSWLLAALLPSPGADAAAEGPRFLGFMRWDDDIAWGTGVFHICSDTCKQKLLSEHLAAPAAIATEAPTPEPLPVVADETAYVPIECEWCGAHCLGGAEHNQRVENGDRYSDGGI